MRHIISLVASALAVIALSCGTKAKLVSQTTQHPAAVVRDTVKSQHLPEGEFVYNLPCKVRYIHPEVSGKALLFLWLHGGVKDQKLHDFFIHNHLDNCAADDSIVNYLDRHAIKAVVLMPMCHKAAQTSCVTWRECWPEVKRMIDDYVDKGLVDPSRIYLAGSSDGGRGTWDYVESHPDIFAAAIAMSCEGPRMTSVPTFFFNTNAEPDCSAQAQAMQQRGSNIICYQRYDGDHGDDAALCDEALLTRYFGFTKRN